jgi:hypothetical protein
MRIFRVLGFVLLLMFLQLLIPRIFGAMEDSLVAFFHMTQTTFEVSESSVASGGSLIPLIPIK